MEAARGEAPVAAARTTDPAAILFSATLLYKWMGIRALTAIERLMGMLLVAISVQMFLDGLGTYLQISTS